MRAIRILLIALALLSAGLMAGASLSIGTAADQVEVWKTDLYGDPAALDGLEVTLPLEAEEQLFWTSVFSAGAPEQAETDFCTFLARRSIRYRSAADSVGVRFTGDGGGYHYLSADSEAQNDPDYWGELYFCLDAIQALAANTPDGETRSRTYALEELTEFYPVEASIGFSYSRLEDERWPETLLRDYFAVPVLPGASVTLSVEKSGSGGYSDVGVEFSGPWYLYNNYWSAPDGDSLLFTVGNTYVNQDTDETGLLDGSHIPGGWGIYRLSFNDEDRTGGTLETVWSLPAGSAVLDFWGDEARDEFCLLTAEEDTLRMRVFGGDMALRQTIDLLPFSADTHYVQTYKGEDFLVPMGYTFLNPEEDRTARYCFAVLERTEEGWALAFTGDDGVAEALNYGGFSRADDYGSELSMAFDGKRLAVRDTGNRYSGYYTGAFTIAVYTADGLAYLGEYDCSLFPQAYADAGRYGYCQLPMDWSEPMVRWTQT